MDEDKNLVQERGEIEAGAVTVTHELIARLEKVTGPDREIDAQIAMLVGAVPEGAMRPSAAEDIGTFATSAYGFWTCKDYTASIDAALTLVPGTMWWLVGAGQTRPDEPLHGAQIRKPRFPGGGVVVGEAEHQCQAIALCIAALKARLPG